MSDRRNRDVGHKRKYASVYMCDCWMCTDGRTKLRKIKHRLFKQAIINSTKENEDEGEIKTDRART